MFINALIQIKNAQAAKKETVKLWSSKKNEVLMKILADNKYLGGFEKKGRGQKKVIVAKLKYNKEGEPAIKGIKLISKPSRHIYRGYKEIRPVKGGFGTLVISTSKGVITGSEARRSKLGGEALFEIW